MPPVVSRGKVLIGPGGFAPPPEADEYDNIKRKNNQFGGRKVVGQATMLTD